MSRAINLLLAGSLLLAILAVQPGTAGTAAAPEITDATGDHALVTPQGPSPVPPNDLNAALAADLVKAWVDNETATNITVHVQAAAPIAPGIVDPLTPTASYTYTFSAKAGLRTVSAGATVATGMPSGPAIPVTITATGSARNVSVSGALLTFQIPRSALDNATEGTKLTNLTVNVVGSILVIPATAVFVSDVAPNSGFGGNYTFQMDTMGHETVPGTGGGTGNPNGAPGCTYRATETNRSDADADCLPDAWERQYFPSITAQDGNGDPDGDGCNNRCEYLHGTDPTKKDTDGDGSSDGDEVEEGTSPTDPNSHPAPPPTTTTTTTTSTSTATTSTSTSATSTSTSTSAPTSQSALDKIEAEAGYAVASGAAMGAVVLLSLIGLFGRWGA